MRQAPARRGDSGGSQRRAKTFLAQAHRLETFGAADVGDALAAEPGEMLDRKPRSAFVVGEKAKGVRVVDPGEGVDHRQAARRRFDRLAPVGAASGGDEAVDALAQQLLDVAPLPRRIVGGVAHEDGDSVVEQAPFKRRDDRKGETAVAVVRQDADRHRAGAMQALGQIVRPVVDLLGDPQHLGSRLVFQPAIGVQRLGRRADRHAGEPRDVADRARGGRAGVLVGHGTVGGAVGHFTPPESSPEI